MLLAPRTATETKSQFDRASKERVNLEVEIETLKCQVRTLEEKNVRYLEVIGGGFNTEPALRATQLRESKRNHEAAPINFDELTDLLEQAEIQIE